MNDAAADAEEAGDDADPQAQRQALPDPVSVDVLPAIGVRDDAPDDAAPAQRLTDRQRPAPD